MEYDVALKEAIRDSAKKFLDAEKAELVEEKEGTVKDEKRNYIITVKSIYIRDAEMFCPEA